MDHPYPDSEVGRCRSCGFLAKHVEALTGSSRIPPPRFFEIESEERGEGAGNEGLVFHHYWGRGSHDYWKTAMVCLVGAASFRVRMSGPSEQKPKRAEARRELGLDRSCQSWFPYQPGQTPIEHLERSQMLDLQRRREEVDRDIAEMRKEIELKALEVSEKIADASALQVRATRWHVFIAAVGVAIGAGVVFLAAAVFQGDTNVAVEIALPTPTANVIE